MPKLWVGSEFGLYGFGYTTTLPSVVAKGGVIVIDRTWIAVFGGVLLS